MCKTYIAFCEESVKEAKVVKRVWGDVFEKQFLEGRRLEQGCPSTRNKTLGGRERAEDTWQRGGEDGSSARQWLYTTHKGAFVQGDASLSRAQLFTSWAEARTIDRLLPNHNDYLFYTFM